MVNFALAGQPKANFAFRFFAREKNLLLSFFSAALLVLSFPNFNFSFLIWIALVPFFFLLDGKSPRAAFLWGWATGYLFFLGTHYWLIHVTLPGMLLVNLYLGIYFGLFGAGYAYLMNGFKPFSVVDKLWVLPCFWVALEFARDRLFTGFGWACLGHSQYQVLPLIQIADIAGVFGVSFVVVMVNVFFKGCLELPQNFIFPLSITVLVLGIVLGYGYFQLPGYISKPEMNLWVAVVQPNVPQSRKWDPSSWEGIQKKILDITRQALIQKPDLVIWPETSFPGYTWQSPDRYQEIKDFVGEAKVPLLLGTVTVRNGGYYNSAILFSEKGEEAGRYDKMHLVPFGEFLPLRPLTNFIENFVPIGDFSKGDRLTVFPNGYSALICFEDTVAPVVRRLVRNGPKFLVNMTNDGWFKDTNAPFLHLQASVLQAVSNRRAIIRAANTGVSGDISPCGVQHIFRDTTGRAVMAEGFVMSIVQPNEKFSFYTRFGDVFAWLCVFCVGGVLIKRKYWL